MTTIKFPLDNSLTLQRSAFFPARSRTEVTTWQKFQTLHLALECLYRRSTRYSLLVTTFWDFLFHFYWAARAIFAKVALPVASGLVLSTQFHWTVFLAFVQRMLTVIGMTHSFANVTTWKAKRAWQDTSSFWRFLEVVYILCMDHSLRVVAANQLQRLSYCILFLHLFDDRSPQFIFFS